MVGALLQVGGQTTLQYDYKMQTYIRPLFQFLNLFQSCKEGLYSPETGEVNQPTKIFVSKGKQCLMIKSQWLYLFANR